MDSTLDYWACMCTLVLELYSQADRSGTMAVKVRWLMG